MNMLWNKFAVTFVILFVGLINEAHSQMVTTSLGQIQGTRMTALNGTQFEAYRGIKYARPPTEHRRFAAPEPVEPWNTVLQATADSKICPQSGATTTVMSEDCLALNIYTRNSTGSAPVIVYIHGGSNKKGSGHSVYEAGPQYLMDHDIVFVSINYRLGALGFLVTNGSYAAEGNFGYLDQVLALTFVRDHITSFGGDRNSVTIVGMSAGSKAVSLHLTSQLSTGLFHRAILMSGSTTNTYSIDNEYWTQKLAHEASCPQYNGTDVVNCLRTLPWERIIEICSRWEPYGFINMKWNYQVHTPFVMQHPTESIYWGYFARVPIMVGITKNELDFSAIHQENNTGLLNDIDVNFDKYSTELFMFDKKNAVENERTSKAIKDFYIGKDGKINSTTIVDLGLIFSDSIIGHGVHRLVDMARNYTDVYYYSFDYQGQKGLYNDAMGKPRGVGHADDLQYVMPSTVYGVQKSSNDPDIFMVHRMTLWFATFAKTGVPTPEWRPATNTSRYTMHNDKTTTLVNEFPYMDRYQLWDQQFPIPYHSGSEHLNRNLFILTSSVALVGTITKYLF